METELKHNIEVNSDTEDIIEEYRKEVSRLLETEIRNLIDEEMEKARQEILEEQRNAIRQLVEEHRAVIREVVEKEKEAIWTRLDNLRQSIFKMGL